MGQVGIPDTSNSIFKELQKKKEFNKASENLVDNPIEGSNTSGVQHNISKSIFESLRLKRPSQASTSTIQEGGAFNSIRNRSKDNDGNDIVFDIVPNVPDFKLIERQTLKYVGENTGENIRTNTITEDSFRVGMPLNDIKGIIDVLVARGDYEQATLILFKLYLTGELENMSLTGLSIKEIDFILNDFKSTIQRLL
jgi:hypothetical protein